MVSKKINLAIKAVIVVMGVVLALGAGLLFGYQYILNQDVRYKGYNEQVLAVSQIEALGPTPTPAPTTVDEEGQVFALDEEGNTVPTTESQTLPPTSSVPAEENVVITEDSPGAIMIYISLGDSTKTIAEKLKNLGIIDNAMLFGIFSKFNGFDGSYKYGTHFLRKNMSYDQVMFVLSQQPATRTILFQEGDSYRDIKRRLKDGLVNFDEAKLDALMRNAKELLDYDLVRQIPSLSQDYDVSVSGKRDFALEGYLYPDTYRFDVNADEETILRTFLNNTEFKITDDIKTRAADLNMSVDQVLTLASIIQKESGIFDDMRKVSRVFHNRLDQGMALMSDATINYIRNKHGQESEYVILDSDIAVQDPYNTYQNLGLPPGPICSPGLDAIKAALYPDTDQPNLLYFVAKGDGSGENAFAETAEGHQQNVETYFLPIANAGN